MRCSSGSVSWLTSIMGGWYVCIIDMGRTEARESALGRPMGLGDSYLSNAVAEDAFVGGGCGVEGDAGAGEAVADAGVFLLGELPPHSDMNERTVRTAAGISKS